MASAIAASLSRIAGAEEEDGEARMPLSALFKEAQLRPLDELVEQIRPMVSSDLDVSVRMARRKAEELQEEFPNLTEDERAMLTLYTIEMFPKESSLYFVMNQALRARDRKAVQPWRDSIWLLLTAMRKLPRVEERIVQRGVTVHSSKLGKQAKTGKQFLWAGFSSTTTHVESLQAFLGQDGDRTKWLLQLRPHFHAVSVQSFSLFPGEHEILLPPNMEFRVKSVIDLGHGLTEVQCEQIEELDPLMDFSEALEPSLVGPIAPALLKAKAQGPEPGVEPSAAKAEVDWLAIAEGGGQVGGKTYTKKECFEHAVETDSGNVKAWYNLGSVGGGAVKGVPYDQKSCYERALECDERAATSEPWNVTRRMPGHGPISELKVAVL
ncbi:unnamed protein product [Durusdinium trenchii]|uniref:ADP ribosyltransferase domain-containing protein n=1 Tax=Durusdinium trenchii TaxID=1381693 RepID=A0ABP0MVV9_9DINO